MRTSIVIALALVACEPPTPVRRDERGLLELRLAVIRMKVPAGWTSRYDLLHDAWVFESSVAKVRFAAAPPPVVASPDALRHYLVTKVWADGTTADFETRASLPDGYATTLVVHAAAEPAHPVRALYVVKQLGSAWFQCTCDGVVDDATRDTVLALCKSLKR